MIADRSVEKSLSRRRSLGRAAHATRRVRKPHVRQILLAVQVLTANNHGIAYYDFYSYCPERFRRVSRCDWHFRGVSSTQEQIEAERWGLGRRRPRPAAALGGPPSAPAAVSVGGSQVAHAAVALSAPTVDHTSDTTVFRYKQRETKASFVSTAEGATGALQQVFDSTTLDMILYDMADFFKSIILGNKLRGKRGVLEERIRTSPSPSTSAADFKQRAIFTLYFRHFFLRRSFFAEDSYRLS
ncbi:hypothetical protein EVAR_78567_1 [Eumeta japonica]|uniref:Uncharacterized protein n=1 Tax=Eumeta variegata TaxID=151549 RepID=A0A4C1W9Q8_EUMVA|nr:hypothetical protein EVAR_78567_1 [Eumeta japonica]